MTSFVTSASSRGRDGDLMRRLTRLSIFSLVLAGALAPRPALWSACNQEIVVQIAFARGATQWVHRGPGTTYVGYFKGGQSLTIGAAGGVGYPATTDFGWARNSQDQWEISVAGPAGFSQSSDFGTE